MARLKIIEAQRSLLAFTQYTKPDYKVNWHHKLLCEYLDKFANGEITKLIVTMPPRHGKSELVSRKLPAFLLGRNPSAQIISCSYSSDLASMFNRDVQRVIDTPEYARIFPGTRLNDSNVRANGQGQAIRNSDAFEIVGRGGFYKSAGVGGGITGLGAHIAIIDDPVRNMQDAMSPTMRQNVWEWYTSTLYTRLMGSRQVLLTLTRWHEDDLAGRLLQLAKSDSQADQWVVLNLPARFEEENAHPADPRKVGEALWEENYGDKVLLSIEKSVGSRVWTSLYQQRPSPDEGNVVKKHWWKFYAEAPKVFDEIVNSWDLTFKKGTENDFTVGQVWGRVGINKYLLYQIRARMGFNDQIVAINNMRALFGGATAVYVEDAANAQAALDVLKEKISGLILVPTDGNSKEARALAASPQIEAGNVWLPDPQHHSWVAAYLEAWSNFPNARFDDEIDASTQALLKMSQEKVLDWTPVSIAKQSIWGRA